MYNRSLKFHNKLPRLQFMPFFGKAINYIIAKFLKKVLDSYVPNFLVKSDKNCEVNKDIRDYKLIVSLTSYPARIDSVWIVIECMLRQSVKPDSILLWLSSEQITYNELPSRLIDLQKRGLVIRFVENDLKSHKKYFYALNEFKDSLIVTIDDDVYYHQDILKVLLDGHMKYPNCIIANRAHLITFVNDTNEIDVYKRWMMNYKKNEPDYLLVPTGVGGVLYPPNSISDVILDENLISKLCPNADDLWLKVGGLINSTKVHVTKTFNKDFISVGESQETTLLKNNSKGGGNDEQLKRILEYFNLGNLEQYRDGK